MACSSPGAGLADRRDHPGLSGVGDGRGPDGGGGYPSADEKFGWGCLSHGIVGGGGEPDVLPCELWGILAVQGIFQSIHKRYFTILVDHGDHRGPCWSW